MTALTTRVVITGRGVVSPIGNDISTYWRNLLDGVSGVARITLFDPSDLPTQIAAEVKEWDPTPWIEKKEARRMSRCSQFAVAAATQALEDANLTAQEMDEQTGVLMGTGFGGIEQVEHGVHALLSERGVRAINPFALAAALPNIPAFHVAERFGIKGHLGTVTTACASGTQALTEAAELIRRGWCHTVLSGGTEAVIVPVAIGGFSAMRGMSTRNDDPTAAVRPFDRERDGFLVGEGAAIFVLESLDHAEARGAHIYGEVLSGASTGDAYHIAQPDPNAAGAIRAIKLAAHRSGVSLDQIQYINPHGPGTPLGDAVEVLAMKTAFGEAIYDIPISSTKSMIGHAMGAAGALEGLATLLTLENQMIHPTINHTDPDDDFDLDFVTAPRPASITYAMSNNFGLGGQNASVILKRWMNGNANGSNGKY